MRKEVMTEEDKQEVARLVEKTGMYLERVDSLLI
jgi:hypothetical protein